MDEHRIDRRNVLNSLPLFDRGQAGFFARNRLWMAVIVALLVVFFLPMMASAGDIGETVGIMVATVFHILTGLVGELLIVLVGALIWIAQYNGFVTSTAVANGWVIVRDIANMFFIIALLLIAFGTMLGIGQYHYSKTLPRLIIMAILVNFSRTICGLLIDFSQVVMLTFVNGFKEAAGGNFVNAFGLNELMEQPAPDEGAAERAWIIAMGFILAFALLSISVGVILIMIVVLVVRIVFLWLLVVLSPLAFLATAIPIGRASQFYGRWWDNFNKQVIVGPFMAFFLWLALISASADGDQAINKQGFEKAGSADTGETYSSDASESLSHDNIVKFIISIGLLLGGVAMAQEMSQGAVGFGKNMVNRIGRAGVSAGKFAGRMGGKAFMASGGELAINKMKTTALGVGTRIPLLKGAAGKALGQHRATQAAKVKETQTWMTNLTPDERKRFKGGIATNPAARARQLAAHQADLERAGKGWDTGMDAKEFNKSLKETKRLGGVMNVDNTKTILEAKKNSPKLLVDSESTGAEHDKQVESQQTIMQSKRAKFYEDANKNQIDDASLSRGNAREIARGMKNGEGTEGGNIMEGFAGKSYSSMLEDVKKDDKFSGKTDVEQQAEALNRMEALVKKKQEDFKTDPANYNMLSSSEQASVLKKASKDDLKQISPEKIAATYGQLDKKEQADVADRLTQLDDRAIRNLPQEMGKEIRQAMEDSSRVMSAGGTLNEAFEGYNSGTGNFTDASGRQEFGDWIKAKDIEDQMLTENDPDKLAELAEQRRAAMSERIGQVPPSEMQRNGAANDVAIEVVSNTSANDLEKMMGSGNTAQVEQVINVVNQVEAANVEEAVSRYEDSLPLGMEESKAKSMIAGFEQRLRQAKADAEKIMTELSSGKGSVSEMVSAGKAQEKIARANERKAQKIMKKLKKNLEE